MPVVYRFEFLQGLFFPSNPLTEHGPTLQFSMDTIEEDAVVFKWTPACMRGDTCWRVGCQFWLGDRFSLCRLGRTAGAPCVSCQPSCQVSRWVAGGEAYHALGLIAIHVTDSRMYNRSAVDPAGSGSDSRVFSWPLTSAGSPQTEDYMWIRRGGDPSCGLAVMTPQLFYISNQ